MSDLDRSRVAVVLAFVIAAALAAVLALLSDWPSYPPVTGD